jgi:hypothetical protein
MRVVRVLGTLVVVTLVAAGVLALLAHLSGGEEDRAARPRPVPSGTPVLATPETATPAPVALTRKEARAALLTAADVPAGWHAIKGGDSVSSTAVTTPATCADGLNGRAKRVTLARASFSVPGTEASPGGTFDETIYRPAGSSPVEQLAALRAKLARCPAYTTSDPVAGSAVFHLGALAFPALGDGTLAAAVQATASVATVTENSVLVAVGPVVVRLDSFTVTDQLPAQDLQRLARSAVERIYDRGRRERAAQ